MKDLRIYYLKGQSLVFFVKIKEICIAFVHVAKKNKKKNNAIALLFEIYKKYRK